MWPILGAALAAGSALVQSHGQKKANERNIQLAREQMAHQDRSAQRAMDFEREMSNTAVRRRVEDLRAAGLNPALAYDSYASQPSGPVTAGSSARVEDIVGPGLSSARAALSMKQQLEIAKAQSLADLRLKAAQTEKTRVEGATNLEYADLLRSQRRETDIRSAFSLSQQPYQLRSTMARAILDNLMIPSAQNEAELSRRLGIWRPALGVIGSGSRSLGDLFRLSGQFRR